jgi:hypothetical protein
MFGIGYEEFVSPCRVAINATKHRLDADFFLDAHGREFPFQIVEVMEPGRRRGAEYKPGALKHISYDPDTGRANGPQWITRKLEQKVAKNYANAGSVNLLLYANFPAQGLQAADVIAATSKFKDNFASAWVQTALHLTTLWSRGDLGQINGWGVVQSIEEHNKWVDLRKQRRRS